MDGCQATISFGHIHIGERNDSCWGSTTVTKLYSMPLGIRVHYLLRGVIAVVRGSGVGMDNSVEPFF